MEACYTKVCELNGLVTMNKVTEVTEAIIKDHSVVVLAGSSLDEQRRINAITHPASKYRNYKFKNKIFI